jgi:hypothetical protein
MLKTEVTGSQAQINKIVAGSLIDVEVLMPAGSRRVKTEFIGLLDQQFIILNHPNPKRLGAALDYLKEGATLIIRALLEHSGGQIIAFRGQVKSVTVHPARLIFLHFPSKVQLIQLRNHTRIPTLIPAQFVCHDFKTSGVIKDISLKGLQFHLTDPSLPAELKEATCQIVMTGKEQEEIVLKGQVCSVKHELELVHLGIKFTSNQDLIESVLKDYLIDLSVIEHGEFA